MRHLIVAAAFASQLVAQEDTANASKARAVVMRHVDAVGGVEALSAAQSVHTVMSMQLPMGITQRIEMWVTKPNLAYGRVWNQFINGEFGFDGKVNWSVDSEEGARILPRPADIMSAATFDPLSSLARFEVKYLGLRDRGGKKMEALQMVGPDGQLYTQYFDAKTGLFERLDIGDPVAPASSMRFEKYKKFDNILYATVISTKATATAEELVARVHSVDHKPVDPKRYALPKEVRALVARQR